MHLLHLLSLLSIFLCIIGVKSVDNALFEAVKADNPALIEKALNSGSDINTIGPGGQTPLMFAVLGGKLKSVKYLLSHNPDTTIGEKDGYTPMHGAGFQGRWKIAQVLIDYGLDPRDVHQDGYEPIHRACWGQEERHMETVKVLIKAGVPYDAKSIKGQAPLDMAQPGTPVYKYLKKIQREHGHHEDEL